MDVWAQALAFLGVDLHVCPGIRFWEVNFAGELSFERFFIKMCNI